MHSERYRFLNFTTFKELVLWSAAGIISQGIRYNKKYKLVPISSFLRKNSQTIILENDVIYTRLTIKTNNGGIVMRDQKKGSDIGTKKQNVVCGGQFVISKIDARNGAFGIISDELDGAIVTNDFPVFDIDETIINPTFLLLVTTTKAFVRFAQSCSSGTTNRQRMDINQFLSQKTPLPSLEEQNVIVASYNNSLSLADQYEQQAKEKEKGIYMYLLDKLGITQLVIKSRKQKTTYLEFYNYTSISQWGVEFIRKINTSCKPSLYNYYRIAEFCQISSGGTPSRSRKEYYKGNILWIKTGELKNDVLYDTEEKITQLGLNNSSAKLYPPGSLVIAMYGATIGQTAKLGVEATTNQACAVLFDIDNSLVETDYLWLYLQSQTEKLKSMAYGGAQPNINAGIVANYLIPIPPLDIQKEIVAYIKEQKALLKQLKQKAQLMRENALKEFETEIFE